MTRKSISFGLGAVFVWGLVFSAWGYCPPAEGGGRLQASGPAVTTHEAQLTQVRQIKEAHHPCHSLKDPYVVSVLRDFLQPVSSPSLLKDVHYSQGFLTDRNLSRTSGPSPPPINAPPLRSQPLFLLNQSLLI